MLISKTDANKGEGNEAFISEWLNHECLRIVKARAYKDRNTREIIRNYSTEARLHLNSPSFSFTFSAFLF